MNLLYQSSKLYYFSDSAIQGEPYDMYTLRIVNNGNSI